VLNFHSSDDSYYEDWYDQVRDQGGWIVILDMPEQTQYDFKRAHLTKYIGLLTYHAWRANQPQHLFSAIDNMILRRLKS
jgi:hypothetical protein